MDDEQSLPTMAAEISDELHMDVDEPGVVKLKLLVTPQGVTLVAGSDYETPARDLLRALGINEEQIARVLCG